MSKLMYFFCIFTLIPAFTIGSNIIDIKPCKLDDQVCVDQSANDVLHQIMPGIPSLEIKPFDPLYDELIEGNLSILKFKLKNVTITGFKTCKLSNVKLNFIESTLKFDLNCQRFMHDGQYDINGRLIILPVEGSGDYKLASGKYYIGVDAELKKDNRNGKNYLNVKNFQLNIRAEEPIEFNFQNLFNGQKDLSDAVHKFAHENWKEVSELVNDSIITPIIKLFFNSVNKIFKTIPMEDVILQ